MPWAELSLVGLGLFGGWVGSLVTQTAQYVLGERSRARTDEREHQKERTRALRKMAYQMMDALREEAGNAGAGEDRNLEAVFRAAVNQRALWVRCGDDYMCALLDAHKALSLRLIAFRDRHVSGESAPTLIAEHHSITDEMVKVQDAMHLRMDELRWADS